MRRIISSRRLSLAARCGAAALVPLAAIAAGGAHAASPRAASVPGVTATSITFGQTAPQSGPGALYGQSTYGADAYFKYVNDHGGVLGRKLTLDSKDDQYAPAPARAATVQLVNQDHVFAEVALNGSAAIRADLTVLEPAGVPVVGPQSGAVYLQTFRPRVFLSWPAYASEGKMMGQFALNKLRLKKIGILYQNDPYGQSLLQGVHDAGVKTVKEVPYATDQANFAPFATQFKSAGVDGVMILAIPSKAILMLNAMANISYKPARILSQAAVVPETFSAQSPQEFPGSYVAAFIPPLTETSNPQVSQFIAAIKKYEPGKQPTVFAAWGYMNAQIAVAGLKGVKGALTRESYVAALNALKGAQTIGGTVSYTATDHHGVRNEFIVQEMGGRFVRVTGAGM